MAILYNRSTLLSLTLSSTISPSSLVTFSDEATASAAQGAYNGQDFQGRNLIVHEDRGATKGSKTASTEVDPNFTGTSVFVNNLSWATTDDELKAYFNQFGSVSAKIALRKDGKSRGWGTVQFSEPEQAMQAVENMKVRKEREERQHTYPTAFYRALRLILRWFRERGRSRRGAGLGFLFLGVLVQHSVRLYN